MIYKNILKINKKFIIFLVLFYAIFFLSIDFNNILAALKPTQTRCNLLAKKLNKNPDESNLSKSYQQILPQCKTLFPDKFQGSQTTKKTSLTETETRRCNTINKLYLNKNRILKSASFCNVLPKCQQSGITPYYGIKTKCSPASYPSQNSSSYSSTSVKSLQTSPQSQVYSINIDSITDTITSQQGGVIQGNPAQVQILLNYPPADFIDWSTLKARLIKTTTQKELFISGFSEIGTSRKQGKTTIPTNNLYPGVYTIKVEGQFFSGTKKTIQQNFIVCPKGGICEGSETQKDETNKNKTVANPIIYEKREISWNDLDRLFDKISQEASSPQSNQTKIDAEGVQHSVIPVLFFSKDDIFTPEDLQRYSMSISNVMRSVSDFYQRETGKKFLVSGVVPVISSKKSKYYYAFSTSVLTVAAYLNIVEDTIRELIRYKWPATTRSELKKWAVIIFPVVKNINAKAGGVAGSLYVSPGDGISRAGFAVIFDKNWIQSPEFAGFACYNIKDCTTSRITAHELGHLFGLPERYSADFLPGGQIAGLLRNALGIQKLEGYCNGIKSRECSEGSVMGNRPVPLRELYLVDEDKTIVRNHYLMFNDYYSR